MSEVKRSIKLISLFSWVLIFARANIIFIQAKLVTNPATGPTIALLRQRWFWSALGKRHSKHNGLFSSLFCAKYIPSEELIDMDTNEILFALEYFEEKILFWWSSVQSNIKSKLLVGFFFMKDSKFIECSFIIVESFMFLSLCFEVFDLDLPTSSLS